MNLSKFIHLRLQGARIDAPVFNGGDPPSNTSSTTVNQLYSPEEAARRAKVMSEAEKIYGQTQGTYSSMLYPGAKPVGLDFLRNFATGPGQQTAGAAQNALNFGLSGAVLNPASNPGLQATIDTATRKVGEAYTDPGGVFSNIRTAASQAGEGGASSRQGIAEGIAGRGYLNTIGDVTGQLTSQAYGQGLDFMKSSMAFAPQTYNLMMQPAATLQGTAQAEEDFAAAQRGWGINAPWMGLQNYANIVFGGANPSTQTTSSGTGARSGPMQLLGGAASGAAIGSMIPGIGTGIGAAAGLLLGLL